MKKEPIIHNLDNVQAWLQAIEKDIDCAEILSAWNLFTDLSYSVKAPFLRLARNYLQDSVYDKLFFGLNLPYFVPEEKNYVPRWNRLEREVKRHFTGRLQYLKSKRS